MRLNSISTSIFRTKHALTVSILLLLFILSPVLSSAEITITLNNSFIEEYKNKTAIDTTFTIDKAHAKPNPASKDGDMHVAGRAPEIGLPVVAEIMNAKFEKEAVALSNHHKLRLSLTSVISPLNSSVLEWRCVRL